MWVPCIVNQAIGRSPSDMVGVVLDPTVGEALLDPALVRLDDLDRPGVRAGLQGRGLPLEGSAVTRWRSRPARSAARPGSPGSPPPAHPRPPRSPRTTPAA